MWHLRGKREIYRIFVEKPKERDLLEGVAVNWSIILKWITSETGRKGMD